MIWMAVYYREPTDSEQFEQRYIDGHLPLIDKYENIQSRSFSRVSRKLMGDFPYSHCFVGTWADKDGWKADLSSDAAKMATEDAQSFATQGFDVVVYEQLA